MKVFENYQNYKAYEPDYQDWKSRKNLVEAKRLEYLKNNPIDDTTRNKDIQRAKALLHAINVMDEYSQSKAENMEIATQQAISTVSTITEYIGMAVGALTLLIPAVRNGLQLLGQKFPKVGNAMFGLPIAVGFLCGIATQVLMQGWGASKEVGASRMGRFDAMKKDLADPKMFAVLTDEQKVKQEELAKKIKTTKDMKKGVIAPKSNMLNPLTAFSTISDMLKMDEEELDKERDEFDDELYKGQDDKIKLSAKDIEKAKRDQQLLHNVVEKIDTASQDYAENVELATNTFMGIALAGGVLTGYITDKILNGLKIKSANMKRFGGVITSLVLSIGGAIFATKLQKQGSRVGRFVAKNKLEENLNNFVYVDDDKTKSISDKIELKQDKGPNFFKFLIQAYKDNAKYNKYIKTKGVENIKKRMALKDIELSEEQLKEAKRLQKNTFKTFNKLDEKSQTFAESIEAVGEMIKIPIISLCAIIPTIFTSLSIAKSITNKKSLSFIQKVATFTVPMLSCIIPTVLLDIHFTKEQKQASRVAHMMALNEMQDVKNYIDYENLEKQPA